MKRPLLLIALLLLSLVSAAAMAQDDAPDAHAPLQLQYDAAPGRTAYPPVVPSSSPLRRTMQAELTCADYSLSYFSRHPAMAKVCGIDIHAAQETATTSCTTPVSSTLGAH